MLTNKKTEAGIYYSRYIASWINAGGDYFGGIFEDWLKSEGCNEKEIREIVEMAICGKLELEKSAKFFIENFSINYADEWCSGGGL